MSRVMTLAALENLSEDELLKYAENTSAGDPLVSALVGRLDELLRRNPGDTSKEALEAALEVAVHERDAMCRWAFGAAIDRLDEGLAVLELPKGPKSAEEFKGPWAWRDFAVGHMRELSKQFLDGLGEAEAKARRAIKTTVPSHPQPSVSNQKVAAVGQRMSKQRKVARMLLIEAANKGGPLSSVSLKNELRESGADRGTAANMEAELESRGWIKRSNDGSLVWTGPVGSDLVK